MAPDAHPIAAHRGLAPHPVALGRAIHEQPAAAWIAARPDPLPFGSQGECGRQQVVRDAIPTLGEGAQCPVRVESEAGLAQRRLERRPPGHHVGARSIIERPDQGTSSAQPLQLASRWRRLRDGDGVGRQESPGVGGGREMVVRGLARSGVPTVVGRRSVGRVGEPEGCLDAQP